MELVKKYDISLSYIFGTEAIDLIAEAKTHDEVEDAVRKLMSEQAKKGMIECIKSMRKKKEVKK